ncbi:MAG: hypothetical protein HUU50_00415 [Candidatus Brocadiae bacterium]|nr:hypothetical protein [Candidatus Brocadiia bacterium]
MINQMGLDVSSVIPRISTESGKISSECRLYSSPVSLPDGTTEWLAGYKEKKLDPWNKEIVHFSSVWDDSDIEDTTLLHSLQKTMASLAKDVGLSNRAQIALAIPDTLDELAHQPIRHAISSGAVLRGL